MAGTAWVARIQGASTNTAAAFITGIRGETGTQPRAFIAAIRGESGTGGPVVFIAAIRGERDAAAGAPTASAGSAVTVQPGSALRLSGAGVAKTGSTITGYTWRVVSKSANGGTITFSNPVATNPRIRVPLKRQASWYVIGLTVTDNLGRISPEATVRVDVRQAQLLAASSSGWQPIGLDDLADPGVDILP